MTQNIYDNDEFFERYSRLPRSIHGLNGAPEWPALRSLLPDLRGLTVLDLGCGFGWFCRWAHENGAHSVLGIDVSERMLARARATTKDSSIAYLKADMEHLDVAPESFDLVHSSLALHYVDNLSELVSQVHDALIPGGRFVLSVEHPMFTAPSHPNWSVDATGRKTWPVDSYLDEGPRITDWLANGVVKQHRAFATYINMLLAAGFTFSHIVEWGPTPDQLGAQPELAAERERPTFLLVAAARE